MRKTLVVLSFLLAGVFGGAANAQNCPGVAPWSFADIAENDPFCPFVTEMAVRGITLGCITLDANTRLFCPDSNLTRLQMALFLTRLGALKKVRGGHLPNFSWRTATQELPLGVGGATELTWTQLVAAERVLTFSGECSVDAPEGNASAWVDLDIEVNGAVVPPTNTSLDAFCGADGLPGFSAWVRPSITVVIDAVAGENRLRMLGRLNGGATGGWLGETSLVID